MKAERKMRPQLVQTMWGKDKSPLQKPDMSESDCEKLIVDTNKNTSDRQETHFNVLNFVLLGLLWVEFLFILLLTQKLRGHQPESENEVSTSCNGHPKHPHIDSRRMLVSLIYNEWFYQQHRTNNSPKAAIQRYLKAGSKTDMDSYPSALTANDNSLDATSNDFIVSQDAIEIPQKGMYEVSTIATIRVTNDVTNTTHALYKHQGNKLLPLMTMSYSAHAEAMSFHQSVLSDTFLLKKGDKLSVFVSGISSIYQKTTPISIRYVGGGKKTVREKL